MTNSRTYIMGGAIFVAMLCVVLIGSQALQGQSRFSSSRNDFSQAGAVPTYQYVGVDQTIARIESATGKIEILSQRKLSRSSLLVEQSKPWEWREIKVRPNRDDRAGNVVTELPSGLIP